jgi:glyoxylase-like metal-dependent hydrolase (beta-lactamase superfamily II)
MTLVWIKSQTPVHRRALSVAISQPAVDDGDQRLRRIACGDANQIQSRQNVWMNTSLQPEWPSFLHPLGDGIYVIDTGFHRDHFDAAYLLVQDGRAAFIDTGTHFAVPRHLAALAALGLEPEAVDWVIPTHVHLDHAGGVGSLVEHLPQARVLVHPRGARHLVDPSALWAGATAVYGAEEMARSYGQVVPVPAHRMLHSVDEMTVHLAGRPLRLIDTPGHARHHHCIWDSLSRGWFTGDTFGLSYREFDNPQGAWILPSCTPVQFEPDALAVTLDRLMAAEPQNLYLTHYGRVQDVPRLAAQFRAQLAEMVTLGESLRRAPDRHAQLQSGLLAIHRRSLRAHGCTLPEAEVQRLLALDIELNAQGMGVWLDRPARA